MKRFITYVYVYENGVKGKNAGFIKAELRDGMVKMEMQFRGLGRFQGKGKLDLIVPDQAEECGIRIPFGAVEFHHGMANTLLEDKETQIASSKYDFSQVVGVRMDLDDTHYLASCWVEHAEQYVCNLRAKRDDTYKSTLGRQKASESTPRTAPVSRKASESITRTAPVSQEACESPTRTAPVIPKVSESITRTTPGDQRASEPPAKSIPGCQMRCESPAKSILVNQNACKSASTPQNLKYAMPEKTESPTIVEKVERQIREASQKMCGNPAEERISQEPVCNKNDEKKDKKTFVPSVELRKIDIADIHKLPKQNWYLCNNSFLIHGFFNYHYLMVKRVTEDSQTKYYLGVPGVYEKPERMMALLFGFPEFEAAEPEQISADNGMPRKAGNCQDDNRMQQLETKTGNFGYWYCLLDM